MKSHDWFETVVQVAIVAAVSYVSAGTLGPMLAGSIGVTSTAGIAVVSATLAGAASATVSGVMNGNLTFKGVLQGVLSGALTAGLMNGLGGAVADIAGPAGTIALRTTVQGGINALLGGSFKDGAIAGNVETRRLDIADKVGQRAIEYKTGYQSATADNLWEVKRDAELARQGWDIQWVFRDQPPSQPLLDALKNAGIRVKIGE